jgi:hypothetical protein
MVIDLRHYLKSNILKEEKIKRRVGAAEPRKLMKIPILTQIFTLNRNLKSE